VASARPMPPFPQPPSGLTAAAGDGQVTLRWRASPKPRVWYWIEYRSRGGSWIRLKYPATSASLTMQYLTNGTSYDFRVRATNVAGDSEPSNVASARPMPPLPQAPSGLTATPGNAQVTLRWRASPTPRVWYWIEYRARGGFWVRLKYPVPGHTSFVAKYLTNGTTYEFRVRATNLAGDSTPSNVAAARPMPPLPTAPSRLRSNPVEGGVVLQWDASPTWDALQWVYFRNRSAGQVYWTRGSLPDGGIVADDRGDGHRRRV
jgi:hypothetical protein